MKKTSIAFLLSASVLTLSACSSNAEDSEKVVESSAGDVTKEEFYEELKNKHGSEVLQQLVINQVLSDKYDVSEEEVNKEVESLKEQYGDQFQMVLQQSGFKNEEDFKKTVRLGLLQEKAAAEDADFSEEELKKQYERMKTEIKASHILVEDQKTAKEVKQKLENGGDFAKLAKEYSTDGSSEQGGDLGYFSSDAMVPKFTDAAYSLEKGEVSDVVQTQHGFHIIKVTDKRDKEDFGSFEEEKDRVKRQLVSQNMDQQALQQKVQKMIEDADVDIKIEQYKDLFKQQAQVPGSGQGGGQAPEGGSGSGDGSGSGSGSDSNSGEGNSEEDSSNSDSEGESSE
ncbi:peptidylprolyl isomerase [Thalassobacillus sp. CUG 92003]|uniref:peptidylprolyl isomerase n=1 Tax=Thalassobacillus sp. CUG 92003 TaxID=2736641 RepID=UPI0015E7D178|nr:peptidylprolyl isomerase [Thalassobacillus sp. CUG 92003]